jgi:pilus assembly protein Flp/PilA
MFALMRRRLGEGVLRISRSPHERARGQGLVEYAFILVFIAMVVIAILVVLGHQVNNVYSNVSNGISH